MEQTREAMELRSVKAGSIHRNAVRVTYHMGSSQRTSVIELFDTIALESIRESVKKLFPSLWDYRIFAETPLGGKRELITSDDVMKSLQGRYTSFPTLSVFLEVPNQNVGLHDAYCDECRREIFGRRFHCVECADFDLCADCEKQEKHSEHALLRIVNRQKTRIPRYILDNAPSFVYKGFYLST